MVKFDLSAQFKGVEIISSDVSDGEMNYNLPEGQKNFKEFVAKNIKKPTAFGWQPHNTVVEFIDKAGRYKQADGLITKSDFALVVKTADCVPLILYNQNSGLIGAIHVSRKNLLMGVIPEGLKPVLNRSGAVPESIMAFLGPHIRAKSYVMKEQFINQVKKTKWEKFVITDKDKKFFNLTAALINELEEIGAKEENIIDCGIDTFSDIRFFSSRRLRSRENRSVPVFLTIIFKNG
jgi:YfiH family protein